MELIEHANKSWYGRHSAATENSTSEAHGWTKARTYSVSWTRLTSRHHRDSIRGFHCIADENVSCYRSGSRFTSQTRLNRAILARVPQPAYGRTHFMRL